jgi:hypothetical protein
MLMVGLDPLQQQLGLPADRVLTVHLLVQPTQRQPEQRCQLEVWEAESPQSLAQFSAIHD